MIWTLLILPLILCNKSLIKQRKSTWSTIFCVLFPISFYVISTPDCWKVIETQREGQSKKIASEGYFQHFPGLSPSPPPIKHFAPRPFMTRLKWNLWLPTVVLLRCWLKFSHKKSMNEKNLFYFFCSRSLYNYDVITWRKDIIDSLLPFKFFFSGGRFRLLIIILLTISITSLTIGTLLLVVFCFYYHK